ncbi:hypothetical protein LX73_1757 [Fodinibius salinus]|uniref:Uncharacterized protein n=1 Tax=Fodinibius salinus TaxID=860790 RepID=A0A5D3YKM0_9BACT|nr:hypothetical protein [Fodinibius salinus]TYP94035.1 hypothetical protein LX73_1757 [Fodinibius salinus]
MVIRKLLFVFVIIGTLLSTANAQVPELIKKPQFRSDAKAAVDSMYNFQFSGAEQAIAEWKQKYPEHPIWMLLSGIEFWWKVLSDLETTAHDKQFFEIMKKTSYQVEKLLYKQPSHADGLLIKAIANGYVARQYANREEWLNSLQYGRKAMSAHDYLMNLQPEMDDLKLAEGLKKYYLAHLPEEYPIVKTVSWALPKGDKKQGLSLIKEASQQAVFARAEATYFLGNINFNYEDNLEVAVNNFEKLAQKYPRNNFYARRLVKSYYQNGQKEKALQFINATLQRWDDNQLPYLAIMQEELLTWKGRILEQRGKDKQALDCYRRAFEKSGTLPNPAERSFYVISGYAAGKILHKQGNTAQAKTYLNAIAGARAESSYRQEAKELLSAGK